LRERLLRFQQDLRDQGHAKGASLRDEVARGL
jgi:5-(carboxyamino)imidazole ribonucleotide mutase